MPRVEVIEWPRVFKTFFAARSVSLAASSMVPVSLSFAVLDSGAEASLLGSVLAAQTIPLLVFLVIGGGLADRIAKVLLVRWSNLATGLVVLTLAIYLKADLNPILIIVVAMLYGISDALTIPALRGIVPELVQRELLFGANARLGVARNLARTLGPAAAGIAAAVISGGDTLLLSGGLFIVAGALFWRVPVRAAERGQMRGSMWSDLREGWAYFRSQQWIWSVTVGFALFNLAYVGAWQIAGPVQADDSFGREIWGLILAANAVGAIAVGSLMSRVDWRPSLRSGIAAISACAVPLVCLATSAHPALLGLAALVAGAGATVFSVTWNTALQSEVPADKISRVSSFDDLGAFSGVPIGQFLAGALVVSLGADAVALAGAAIVVLSMSFSALAMRHSVNKADK